MPPKKNKVELNKKQTAKKPQIQKKQKVVKPKLKTPTVIKVKIPITKPVRTVFTTECKGNSPTKNNIKIQLSNDVARYALHKPNATKTEPKQKDVTIKNTMVIQEKPKRTRKKKMPVPLVEVKEEQIETNCDIASSSLVETFKNPSPIKSNKINTRKAIKKIDKKDEITPKVTTEPSKNIQIKKSNLNRKRPLRSDVDATPVKKRRGPRGKKSVDDTTKADLKSPSPLDAKAIDVTRNTAPPSVKTGNKSGNTDAGNCSSRRTSTLSESLSWTKEISSSSTTTLVTVCSATDFFRIDNKLPLIELKDLKYDNKINKSTSDSSDTDSSTSSSSSDSSSSVCFSPKTPEMECPPSPNLSTSTISKPVSYLTSPNKDIKPNYTKEQLNDFTKTLKTLEKVKTMMNSLDQEILNWIGYADEYTNIENIKKLKNSQSRIANHFQKENGVVKLCHQISNNSQEKPSTVAHNQDSTNSKQKVQTAVTNEQFVASSATENISSTFTDKKSDTQPTPMDVFSKPDSPKYNNDVDDDALSLYAESITAIDSSKYNTSVASIAYAKSFKEHEEYVPEPLSKTFKPSKPYQPTKIDSRNDILVNYDINYEKTDETAGNHLYTNFESQTVKPAVTQSNIQEINVHYDNSQNKRANVILTLPNNHTTKLIYQDICVYNLVGGCTRSSCRYSHIKLTEIEIKNHIVRLTNEVFIRELLYVKNKSFLRNLFGLCYVEECERRKLTRKLIEMAHKFIAKSKNNNPEEIALRVSVVEIVLLHLNSVDLHEYRDLLTHFIANKQFCEHLMQYIGQTQNFSRFKSIFIKLADFLVDKNRKVNPVVASNILERVAILPLDEQIARAVLKVMEISTDNSVVFNNSMIMKFESQLTKLSEDLLMKFHALKANAKAHAAASLISSLASPTVQEVRNNSLLETDMYVSPDSSVFNGSNTSYRQLSRTLDLSRPKITITNDFAMSRGGNDNDNDDFGQESSGERYRCWRQSSFKTRRPTEIRNDFKRNNQQRPYLSYNPGNFHRRF